MLPDPRARHYWDPEMLAGGLFAPAVGTSAPAWDVWMLFERDAVWQEDPPTPAWWEHQLGGLPAERRLDPTRFAAHARHLETSHE